MAAKLTSKIISTEDFNSLLGIRRCYNTMVEGLRCLSKETMIAARDKTLYDIAPDKVRYVLRLNSLHDDILSGKIGESQGGIVFKDDETASTITELEEKVKELAKLRSLLSVDNLIALEEKAKELEKLRSLLSANAECLIKALLFKMTDDIRGLPYPMDRLEGSSELVVFLAHLKK